MDELDLLHDVLASPDPSTDRVNARRHQMQRLIRQRTTPSRRRRGWRLIAIGLTAAAAAGAVAAAVVLTPQTAPAPRERTHPVAANRSTPTAQSARQILLTAAISAQRAPVASGTYWHVRTRARWNGSGPLSDVETWTTKDGQLWLRDLKTGSQPVKLLPSHNGTVLGPFFLGGQEMTFSQIQQLPTEPGALTAWIVANAAAHGGKSGGPAPDAARQREDVFESLDSLLSQLPASPALRAAAFRALAALPGVTSLGPTGGGQGIRFSTAGGAPATLIVDPATGQIRATNYFVGNDGSMFWQPTVDATITCEWTNTLG